MLRTAFRRLPTALVHLENSIPRFSLRLRATPPPTLCRPRALTLAHAHSFGVYDFAVVRDIPSSLPELALRQSRNRDGVDLKTAIQQHREYIRVLQELGLKVVTIPTDERFPDCVFVEDTAVITDGVALLTILGHESRRGETVAVKEALGKIPGLSVVEMVDPGRMDGGDVLFTGREFIVGLSHRTNSDGVAQLASAFTKYEVLPVKVSEGLHLKSFMSMVGEGRIGIGVSEGARLAREQITSDSQFQYEFVEFPSDTAANCLFINDNLVHVSSEISPDSCHIFKTLPLAGRKIPLNTSELGKVDGCLTCSSLLINSDQT